jgi:hypothetical protein
VRIDVTCRFSPSRVSRGKNSHPWRRMIAPANPRAPVASSGRNTSTPGAMSGSFSTTFGLAWWRECFVIHHEYEMPTNRFASVRPAMSLALPDSNTWRCEASWARKANWVKMMPSPAAMSSWNQLSPRSTKPVTAPPSATTVAENIAT